MAPGVFWGIILIIIGASVIIRVVFNIHLPVFRVVIALVFILIGIRILIGPRVTRIHDHHFKQESEDVIFNERDYHTIDKKEYSVVFGKATYDLRDIKPDGNQPGQINFNVVFGGAIIRLNPDIPVKIKTDAVFSGVKMPDNSSAVFGTSIFTNPVFREDEPYLYIKVDAVFSGVEFSRY
ncbi:MAG: hypothetical protein GVY19_06460 [Bacteroidetes bacterium]|nr:hypothetical protein [Bacteroidota bacterium]